MFLTAVIALIVAAKAPRAVARFAEEFRRKNQAEDDVFRWRLNLFANLMAYRSEILNPAARQAINTVDVAFADFPEVRDARRLFIDATNDKSSGSTVVVERYYALIEAVARAVALSHLISGYDVRAGYYPEAIGKLDQAALLEAEEKIARRLEGEKSEKRPPKNRGG
jgi:hypothetical protein